MAQTGAPHQPQRGAGSDLTSELYLPGNISKNCTSDGWSEIFPDFIDACSYDDPEDEGKVRPVGGRRGQAGAGGGWWGQALLVHFPVAHTAP